MNHCMLIPAFYICLGDPGRASRFIGTALEWLMRSTMGRKPTSFGQERCRSTSQLASRATAMARPACAANGSAALKATYYKILYYTILYYTILYQTRLDYTRLD